MFNRKTIFILGAGASCHYGYPTGEGLVQKVIEKAAELEKFCKKSAGDYLSERTANLRIPDFFDTFSDLNFTPYQAWNSFAEKLEILHNKLKQVHPLVIDYFLEENPTVRDLGKFLIAWVILECESQEKDWLSSKNNWYRYILNNLSAGAKSSSDLSKNDISFVTFNYDVSLENHLHKDLLSIDLFEKDDIEDFIQKNIIHVYGQISEELGNRKLTFKNINNIQDPSTKIQNDKRQKAKFEIAWEAAKNIRTINGSEKEENYEKLIEARNAISRANFVYILGFSFDAINCRRLQLEILKEDAKHQKCIFFTNYEDTNIVNKRASHVFWGHEDDKKSFVPPNPMTQGKYRQPPYFEKSIRNVYEAFEKDFDLQG